MKFTSSKYITILIGLAPILFFVYYVWQYTINVPFLDDSLYYTKAVVDVEKSKSWSEAFWIFMRQHTITEHKTPISRFVAWLIYKTTGKLDFVLFSHLGNLALLGMLGLFWTFFRKIKSIKLNITYFLPVPFLIFQMQTYENQFWAICNWTYYPIGFLQMLTFYFLSYQKPKYFLYAMLTAIFVTFTFSNGMFVFLPAVLILLFQKRYKALIILVSVATICLIVYFSNYTKSPIVPPSFSLVNILTGFVLMLGAYVDVQGFHQLSLFTTTLFGVIILGFLGYGGIWLLRKCFNLTPSPSPTEKGEFLCKNSPLSRRGVGGEVESDILFLVASMMCLCMSAGAVAYSRYTGQNGFEEMFTSRYRFISVTLLCLVYLFSLLINKERYRQFILILSLPLTIFLYGYSYYFLHENNVNFRERLVAATFNFKYHNSWVLYPFNNDWTVPVDTVNAEALRKDIYELPVFPFTKFQDTINKDSVLKISNLAFILEQRKDRFVLKNETLDVENPLKIEQNIILKSKKNTYLLPLKRQRNKSRKDLILKGNYFWKGFETEILKNTFIPDEYTIGLLKIQDGKYDIQYSNLKIKL